MDHRTDQCTVCLRYGHNASQCKADHWPRRVARWLLKRGDSTWPIWLEIIGWAYVPYGCWLILQQISQKQVPA